MQAEASLFVKLHNSNISFLCTLIKYVTAIDNLVIVCYTIFKIKNIFGGIEMKDFFGKILARIRRTSIITYLFIVFLIFMLLFGPLDPYEFAIGWGFSPLENPVLAQIIGYGNIALIVIGTVIIYSILFPFIRLVLRRIRAYVLLLAACIKTKSKMRLMRFPYASVISVGSRGDILIKTSDEKIHIHFIDVIGRARIFTLVDGKTYDICKTVPDRLKGYSFGFRAGGVMIEKSKPHRSRSFAFPEFSDKDGKHIIVVDPLPMEVRYIDGSVSRPLYSGYSAGDIVFYELRDLLKLLERA